MNSHDDKQWNKLNDLLSNSFNNIKYDVRDIRGQVDKLRAVFAHFSTNSIKNAFEQQTKVILELQRSLNHMQQRVKELETRPAVQKQAAPAHSIVLNEVSKVAKIPKATKKDDSKSIYDFPEGEVHITKVQFKAKKNGKKNLNGEWVEITGYGGVDMTGYKLYDKGRKHTFKFPDGFKIYGPVKVFTGKGRNTNTRLYWKNPRPIWNDSGDTATLAKKNNKVVSQVSSEPTFSFKVMK